MNRISTTACISLLLGTLVISNAHAADATVAARPQQSRMKACNAEASGKKGDERKQFMKTCLSNKASAQREKMKQCNVEAGGKKGDERREFMVACLSR